MIFPDILRQNKGPHHPPHMDPPLCATVNHTECTIFNTLLQIVHQIGYILELEQPRKTAKIPQIFSDFYYE